MILDTFPTAEEFYKTYWCKKPFIVRGYIPADAFDDFIDGDTMAGLALEDDIKSRFITNNADGKGWQCQHGPLDEDHFDDVGDKNWSLMVQNVEQYHTETAEILSYFQMSPRWLLDDVMISFSTQGGSVGPHTDSYHTFLVQGIGKRTWKISADKINDDRYVDNPDMKILDHGFDGETFEVTAGDVIYMPPFFGHEGKTLEPAMTFSVGFLGPKLSEMMGDYAQYLEENDHLNKRYFGENLDTDSAGFSVGQSNQNKIQNDIISAVQSDDFAIWMASYFSMQTHDDGDEDEICEDDISNKDLLKQLEAGDVLIRPEHMKLAITMSGQGDYYYLSMNGETVQIPKAQKILIEMLNNNEPISLNMIDDDAIEYISALYNKGILV